MPMLTYILYYFLKTKKISSDLLSYKKELEKINTEVDSQLEAFNKKVGEFIFKKEVFNNNFIVVDNSLRQLGNNLGKLSSTLYSANKEVTVLNKKYLQQEKNSKEFFVKKIPEFELKVWNDTYKKILDQFKEHENKYVEFRDRLEKANPNSVNPGIMTWADSQDPDLKIWNNLRSVMDDIAIYDLNQQQIVYNINTLSREIDSLEKYLMC